MLPPPPERPAEWECCARGCFPCIYDYYDAAVERWKEKVRALGGDPDQLLSPEGPRPASKARI